MVKNYLIIGNPVEHSLSPKIHNYWFKENNINSFYKKKNLEKNQLGEFIKELKSGNIDGANVTVPFKQEIIPYLDNLSDLSKKTQSVNTIYKQDDMIIGDNTDVFGFSQSLKFNNLDLKKKEILILGAGGVVPSIICALEELLVNKIYIKNRTYERILKLKDSFKNIIPIKREENINCDIVINATSLGLKSNDEININFENMSSDVVFYDTIYNPPLTNLLKKAKDKGHKVINGKIMLLFQAQKAFKIWTGIEPVINEKFLDTSND